MSKNPPKGKGAKRARKKYERMVSRGARPRALVRQAMRARQLEAEYQSRLVAWRNAKIAAAMKEAA